MEKNTFRLSVYLLIIGPVFMKYLSFSMGPELSVKSSSKSERLPSSLHYPKYDHLVYKNNGVCHLIVTSEVVVDSRSSKNQTNSSRMYFEFIIFDENTNNKELNNTFTMKGLI